MVPVVSEHCQIIESIVYFCQKFDYCWIHDKVNFGVNLLKLTVFLSLAIANIIICRFCIFLISTTVCMHVINLSMLDIITFYLIFKMIYYYT